jgi:hypothetical protein
MAASHILTSSQSDITRLGPHGELESRTWAQICNIATSLYTDRTPVDLNQSEFALSMQDRMHFFENQLQITSRWDGIFISPFSRWQVKDTMSAYLRPAHRLPWYESNLEGIFGCRKYNERDFHTTIGHSHPCLIEYITSHPELNVPIPEDYASCSEVYVST